MPRGTSDYTFKDHVNEAETKLGDVEHHLSRMVDLLEDGGTTWDARVKRLHAVITLAQQEMSQLVQQYEKNNPE